MSLPVKLLLFVVRVALAILCFLLACRFGTDLDGPLLVSMPGTIERQGLFAAPWTGGNPFPALLIGVAIPLLLLTAAVWILARLSRR